MQALTIHQREKLVNELTLELDERHIILKPSYCWDLWFTEALHLGADVDLARLGREVLMECFSDGCSDLREDFMINAYENMLKLVTNPKTARKRWQALLTVGCASIAE